MTFTIPANTIKQALALYIEQTHGFIAMMEDYGYDEDAAYETERLAGIVSLHETLASPSASEVESLVLTHVA